MNDPTKQDGRWGRPAYAVCVKAFQAIGRKIPRPAERTASGTWSVKTKAAKRVAANAPEVQQYECTTGAAMFWTLFYLSIAGCAIGSVSHWLRKN